MRNKLLHCSKLHANAQKKERKALNWCEYVKLISSIIFLALIFFCIELFPEQLRDKCPYIIFVYLQMVGQNDYNRDELVNGEFGIQVKPELTSIEARVLTPPKVNLTHFSLSCIPLARGLTYAVVLCCQLRYHDYSGKEKLLEPRVGQWNMIDMVSVLF